MAPNFEITESQREHLDANGFLMLPGALSGTLLERLREADERHRAMLLADEGHPDAGRACFVAGSHNAVQDIAALEQEFGWNPPGLMLAPAQPGDILIQHMMVLHSSKQRRPPSLRRTIYAQPPTQTASYP